MYNDMSTRKVTYRLPDGMKEDLELEAASHSMTVNALVVEKLSKPLYNYERVENEAIARMQLRLDTLTDLVEALVLRLDGKSKHPDAEVKAEAEPTWQFERQFTRREFRDEYLEIFITNDDGGHKYQTALREAQDKGWMDGEGSLWKAVGGGKSVVWSKYVMGSDNA